MTESLPTACELFPIRTVLVFYPIPANPPMPRILDGQGYLGARVRVVEPLGLH
jgi:hypothetical protein